MTVFLRKVRIPTSAAAAFVWHERPGAFERLSPPWQTVTVLDKRGGIRDGRVVLQLGTAPLSIRWVLEHRDFIEGVQFRDVQVKGPFRRWEHTHKIVEDGPSACMLEDRIEYEVPLGRVGGVIANAVIEKELARLFRYRHRQMVDDIASYSRSGGRIMKVLVTGASGLVGGALIPFLTTGGHDVVRLVRSSPVEGDLLWDPDLGTLNPTDLEGFDGVIHLAGEGIATGRWTAEKKQRIKRSRVQGTQLLARTLAGLESPPRVLVAASAIGFYGDRAEEELSEESSAGSGFLAEVCKEWEAATGAAEQKGIRVVHARLGIVLTPKGGALAKMLLPFKMGAGGILGDGRQYMSWVTLDDVVGAIGHMLATDNVKGPVNLVAPAPVTNREFTKTLGHVLRRPTVMPLPGFAARMVFGEMADALLLASARVKPGKLMESGYVFRHASLETGLRHILGKER